MNLQLTSNLAQLPQASWGQSHVRSCPIYGLVRSRKRKRYEVALAIDGEAVNIYDVQSPRVISSYAIPPQSRFTCSPCSIRWRTNDAKPMRRTYCAFQRPEMQIQCFTEHQGQPSMSNTKATTHTLTDHESSIFALEMVSIDTCVLDADVGADLLAIHKDGLVRRLSGDLGREIWKAQICHDPEEPLEVLAACCISRDEAKKSWLRRREDILSAPAVDDSPFLLLVTRELGESMGEDSRVRLGIWNISTLGRSDSRGGASGSPQGPLTATPLPESMRWSSNSAAQLDFQHANGKVSVSFSRGHITYDLTNHAPEMQSLMVTGGLEWTSSLHLGSSLVAAASPVRVSIYNPKYQSLQGSLDLPHTLSRKKRKRVEGHRRDPVHFVSYFARINRLVALRGRNLVALDISNSTTVAIAKDHDGGLLANSFGRGALDLNVPKIKMPKDLVLDFGKLDNPMSSSSKGWSDCQRQLDEVVRNGKVENFEAIMMQQLSRHSIKPGTNTAQLPPAKEHVDDVKLQYLISKIFRPLARSGDHPISENESALLLEVAFMPPRLFTWLLSTGRLSLEAVEDALVSPLGSLTSSHLRRDSVMLALAVHDPSLHLLSEYLRSPGLLSIPELMEAIGLVLSQVTAAAAQVPDSTQQTHPGEERMGIYFTDGWKDDGAADTKAVAQLSATQRPVDGPQALGAQSSPALDAALRRLGAYTATVITSNLRWRLDQAENFALIQYLRQQLFRGGHTSSFRSHDSIEDSEQSLTFESITRLLSSCVDAIGPLGFVAQSAEMDFIDRLIPDLKSEISLALTGIEEATYLQGILREVMRYGESISTKNDAHGPDSAKALSVDEQKPGTIIRLYSEPEIEQGDVEEQHGLLPLSLRVVNAISDTKVRKGGGQVTQRSSRQKMHLQGKNIGKYSFERLVL